MINKTLRPKGKIVYENFTGTEKEYNFWNKIFYGTLNKLKRGLSK